MKKRCLYVLLALVMIMAMMPATILAQDSTDKVAQIGSVQYSSIQEAVNAANDGDTIEVIASHDLDCSVLTDGALISINNKAITIDLNGKTITADYSESADPNGQLPECNAVISVDQGSKLTLKDSSADKTGTIYGKTTQDNRKIKYGVLLADAASDNDSAIVDGVVADPADTNYSLVIESGNYKLDYAYDNGSGVLVYSGADAIMLVRGGNFYLGDVGQSNTQTNDYPWIFNSSYNDGNRIIIIGGSFNADVNHQYWEYEIYVPKTKAVKPNSDGKTWEVVDSVVYVDEHHHNYSIDYTREVGYATLTEAVNAANTFNDDTKQGNLPEHITLLKDCKVSDTLHFAKDTEITLNSKKILWVGEDSKPVISFDNDKTVTQFEPTKAGYDFQGWYTDADYENQWKWDFTGLQAGATTSLYANWEVIPAKAPTIEVQGAGDTSQQGHKIKVAFEKDNDYTYSYQWYNGTAANGEAIQGATEAEYAIPSGTEVGIYNYYCVVKAKRLDNGLEDSATSGVITVHLYNAPVAKDDLIFNGTDQNLVNPGVTAAGKTLEYALQVDGEGATPNLEWSQDVPKAKDAGEYTVYYRIAGAQNSDSNALGDIKVAIDKKPITIKPDDKSTYINFTELPAFTYVVEGLIAGDSLVKEPDITCDADNMTAGTYDIVAANADAGKNYKISYMNGTLTVKVNEDIDKDRALDTGDEVPLNILLSIMLLTVVLFGIHRSRRKYE